LRDRKADTAAEEGVQVCVRGFYEEPSRECRRGQEAERSGKRVGEKAEEERL
jgi:hypothetical protein